MFQLITGSFLLLYTAGLVIYYLPKTFSSLYVCLLCGLTGVLSIIAGGGSWILQLIQVNAQLMIAGCGLFHLHRQKMFAARKAKAVIEKQATVAAKKTKAKQKCVSAKKRVQQPVMQSRHTVAQGTVSMERCA